LLAFLLKAVGISLSGVMAPGATTAATILAGTRRRHAGGMISLGHGVVEFPLMLLVMWGVKLFSSEAFRVGVGLVGGTCLLYMGAGMLVAFCRPRAEAAPPPAGSPFVLGIVVTGLNPYFLLWWATVGLALCTEARQYGPLAFVLFAGVHWLCDLVWLEALSITSHKGTRLFGDRGMKIVLLVCGAAMLLFAGKFIQDAVATLTAQGAPVVVAAH
jgi:threonine/homoserine/homoserine lactone efflux protein